MNIEELNDKYIIIKFTHELWLPDGCGYTNDFAEAGVYSLAEVKHYSAKIIKSIAEVEKNDYSAMPYYKFINDLMKRSVSNDK